MVMRYLMIAIYGDHQVSHDHEPSSEQDDFGCYPEEQKESKAGKCIA